MLLNYNKKNFNHIDSKKKIRLHANTTITPAPREWGNDHYERPVTK